MDVLNLGAHSHALAAEDALRGITDYGRGRVVNRLLAVVVCKADIGYIVALGVLLKLALAGLVAGGTLRAVACKQKLNYHLAVLAQLCGVRAHDHAVLGNYGACSLDAATLVFDNAKPAAAVYRQAFAVAEVGDINVILLSNFKDIASIFKFAANAVYNHTLHIIKPPLSHAWDSRFYTHGT